MKTKRKTSSVQFAKRIWLFWKITCTLIVQQRVQPRVISVHIETSRSYKRVTNPTKQNVMVSRHTTRNVRIGILIMLLHRAPLPDEHVICGGSGKFCGLIFLWTMSRSFSAWSPEPFSVTCDGDVLLYFPSSSLSVSLLVPLFLLTR